ncbi:MAG: NAD(P)(+) transhydrogenase (Re/Si-specific) subunit beta [Proteobacteria bacterium]|nr:NAD(P)(+) transhydrogenase (Re/Si-specific) subunit beta [Pseudomonadota bacterium]
MQDTVQTLISNVAFLVAGVLFIMALRGLSSQETARRGNVYGIIGMLIAIAATLSMTGDRTQPVAFAAIGGGAVIGAVMAARVGMTSMPELVALLHSFVGLAAVLVGLSMQLAHKENALAHRIDVYIDVMIGAITTTGSILAFLKLRGSVSGKPMLLPARHLLNLSMLTGIVVLGALYGMDGETWALLAAAGIACVLGVHLVAAIGGADMPVVVSMLNSYSGWTAAAAGFMLDNDLLIITGALVGSSGAILSYIMCKAMNRSIFAVIFGGFGAAPPKADKSKPAPPAGDVQEMTADDLAEKLSTSKTVIIVPGYGMAVARAQHAVREMSQVLRDKGVDVKFAIHPVAGRLPGHMNVLLAEANVPYDIVLEMDEVNPDMPSTDVVIVIGANDIVNPAAEDDPTSPIAGMPVIQVWKAGLVIVNKRSRGAGYAGIDNPLFYKPVTKMLFGDAKDAIEKVVAALKAL